MKPLTYLGFTILSVFIQFCVMDFIHEKFQLDKDSTALNETAQMNNDVMKKINRKPHALFYRTDTGTFEGNNKAQSVKYGNSSLKDMTISTSTDILSTTFDVFYDENTSITDDFFTTESYFTSSEFDNVTEITLLDKSSSTTAKPSLSKKVTSKKKCFCNLLYQKCDINCCCDDDCTEEEQSLFVNCMDNDCQKSDKKMYSCNSNPTCGNDISTDAFNDLFCIVKINLPDKRVKSYYKFDEKWINSTFKWTNIEKPGVSLKYKKKKYEYGDPLWLIKNETLFSMYLPTRVANNYCSGAKQINFLINERVKCNVKLEDLHMYTALRTLEGTKLISVTELSMNNTDMDCSSLHCTNWTVLVCDDISCGDFNKTLHSPKCTESDCNNLALKLEYSFYYSESKITNASVKLYMTKMRNVIPLMEQEIAVKWYLGNESIDDTIQLSGNPGYIPGLPIIASSATYNHTNNFYNGTFGRTFVSFPHNQNGKCVWSNTNNKTLLFGFNTRSKCRLSFHRSISQRNASIACRSIQGSIKESLKLHQKIFLSPYGNPRDVSDDSWVPLEADDQTFLYGEYHSKKLYCYNLVTKYAFVIAFADINGPGNRNGNKIIKADVSGSPYNVTFDSADLSTVLTVDVRFVDISRPVFEFARAPHLSLHLPTNFFFDYPSNRCFNSGSDVMLVFVFSLFLLY